jgi:hypothetical protein
MPPSEQSSEQHVMTRALQRSLRRRLVWSATAAAGAVVAASILVPSYGQSARDASGLLQKQHNSDARARQVAAAEALPHVDAPVTGATGCRRTSTGTPTTTTTR